MFKLQGKASTEDQGSKSEISRSSRINVWMDVAAAVDIATNVCETAQHGLPSSKLK